jgi:hypothetical protein
MTEGRRGETENYPVVLGGGIHMIDLMLWLTGQRPVSVSAVGNWICTRAIRSSRAAQWPRSNRSGLRPSRPQGCPDPRLCRWDRPQYPAAHGEPRRDARCHRHRRGL